MLYRLVRPVKRSGSTQLYFLQRIPADLMARARGKTLALPVGSEIVIKKISPKADSIRVSLRTRDPSQAKIRQAEIAAYLEHFWTSLRTDAPQSLSHKQAVALSGVLYRSWVDGGREQTIALEAQPEGGFRRIYVEEPDEQEAVWAAISESWDRIATTDEAEALERHVGPLIDRLLISKGIGVVDYQSRLYPLKAFAQALRDAFATRARNAAGDYSPDPKSERFPEWEDPKSSEKQGPKAYPSGSLKGLVEDWWREANATGLAVSTYESYRNTMARFIAFLGHDSVARVTTKDVIGFKDFRLAEVNPRTGKPISPKTVKDSDLAGLRAVFNWAVRN